jgi:hypothetical protein
MHNLRILAINRAAFNLLIDNINNNRGLVIDSNTFINEIITRSELLFINEDGDLEFKHRSFQDYFVGLSINNKNNPMEYFNNYYPDSWWNHALFFACGLRPSNDDFVKAIIPIIKIQERDFTNNAIFIGQLTQAAYLIPKTTKKEIVILVLELLIKGWDELANNYQPPNDLPEVPGSSIKEFYSKIPAHIVLLAVYAFISKTSLGSITLSSTLNELINEYMSKDISGFSTREQAKFEFTAFLLASSCAGFYDIEGFCKVFESGIIKNPVYNMIGKFDASFLFNQSWINYSDSARLSKLIKKLDRKVNKQGPYFRSLDKPIPLPQEDNGIEFTQQ